MSGGVKLPLEAPYMNSYETKSRSLTKTILWRVIATLITLIVSYVFTGQIQEATKIALVAAVFAMIAYYLHERIWNAVTWGKIIKN